MSSPSTSMSSASASEDSLTLSKILSTSTISTASTSATSTTKDSNPVKNKKDISFKKEHPFDKRKTEADRIRVKYPDRIPVIIEKAENSTIPDIDKKKYLVPADLTMGQFVYVIRKRIKLPADQAIFIFINKTLLPANVLMSQIYKEHADTDGFLYGVYHSETSFGGSVSVN